MKNAADDGDDNDDEEMQPEIDDDDGDEIDSAVEASDNAMVEDVVRHVENEDEWEEKLTREDINLGCFSISKVVAFQHRCPSF